MESFIASFIFFFAVIDPIGTVPVFIEVTKHMSSKQRAFTGLQSVAIAFCVLAFFALAGEIIFNAIKIPLSAFQISGGIVLFIFALTMILGESKPETELKTLASHTQTAVFPLAIPSIASPGAILAAVILTDNNHFSFIEQLKVLGAMTLVLAITAALLFSSSIIYRVIGKSGASVTSRVMGMILASLAVTQVLTGISTYFNLS